MAAQDHPKGYLYSWYWLTADVKFGLGDETILRLFHPDAKAQFDLCTNLEKLCADLSDPNRRVDSTGIELFYPCATMNASKALPIKVVEVMREVIKGSSKTFWIEEKYDGHRMFLHLKDNEFRYFSRYAFRLYGFDLNEGTGWTTRQRTEEPRTTKSRNASFR
jgi:DNA ligase-4